MTLWLNLLSQVFIIIYLSACFDSFCARPCRGIVPDFISGYYPTAFFPQLTYASSIPDPTDGGFHGTIFPRTFSFTVPCVRASGRARVSGE